VDAEINDLIVRGAAGYHDDLVSDSDIAIFQWTWVAYMAQRTKKRRTSIYGANKLGGTVDWALDFSADLDFPPTPAPPVIFPPPLPLRPVPSPPPPVFPPPITECSYFPPWASVIPDLPGPTPTQTQTQLEPTVTPTPPYPELCGNIPIEVLAGYTCFDNCGGNGNAFTPCPPWCCDHGCEGFAC
jgi:hypothetical protein